MARRGGWSGRSGGSESECGARAARRASDRGRAAGVSPRTLPTAKAGRRPMDGPEGPHYWLELCARVAAARWGSGYCQITNHGCLELSQRTPPPRTHFIISFPAVALQRDFLFHPLHFTAHWTPTILRAVSFLPSFLRFVIAVSPPPPLSSGSLRGDWYCLIGACSVFCACSD